MKTVGKRTFLLSLVILAFCVGLALLTTRLAFNANSWTSQPYNAHLTDENGTKKFGTVYDRNGTVLYSPGESYNEKTKEALLHTTGDLYGNIISGVFSMYPSKISGYNFLTGFTDFSAFNTNTFLTIDSELTLNAYNLLGNKKGAVFIYNYKTGEVLCNASSPSYDPLNIPKDIDSNSYYEGAFLGKNYSAAFTPGSIFKVVTAICAIENYSNWQSLTFNCTGSLSFDGGKVTCLEPHGKIGIDDALMYSCNCIFGELAVSLGADKLTKTALSLGFNSSFSFEEINTVSSKFDVASASPLDLAWSGIGQYTVLSNPYHTALIMGTIAGNGVSAKPYVLEKITTVFNFPSYFVSKENADLSLKYSVAKAIKSLLRNNVENYYGDGYFPGLDVCGKTGTAEVGSDKADTAWFIGFCDNPSTPYAFAVLVEEGGFGYQAAVPIASALLTSLK